MNKTAYIMDKPNCCGECPMSGTGVCRKWNMKDLQTFPKNCPLRDIPEKLGDKADYALYGMGWDDCIREILKERD